jgi:hypothetical protein
MTMMTPDRMIRSLRKTPVLLKVILSDVSQERAQQATDGPDGWSVLETMCHIHDVEDIILERAQLILNQDNPALPRLDNEEAARRRDYPNRNLSEEFNAYLDSRRRFVAMLFTLSNEQWHRGGVHPEYGQIDMLQMAMNDALHDINHFEQIARSLGLSMALV